SAESIAARARSPITVATRAMSTSAVMPGSYAADCSARTEWSTSALERRLVPRLELPAQVAQEATRVRAVDEAVVVRQRDVHDRADRDHVPAELVLYHPWPLHERVGAEDRRLRLADHRRAVEGAVAARVRDRERAALDVLRQQLLVARARSDVRDAFGEAQQVQRLRVLDHRDDQTFAVRELDCDPEVHVVARDDLLAADLAVH